MITSVRTQAGSLFTRTAIATALTKKHGRGDAARYAAERWRDTPDVAEFLKRSAVSATSTTDSGTALVAPGAAEFLGLVRPRTVLGRLTRLQRVPFHRGAAIATGGAVYAWIGEGLPVPVGRLAWTDSSLPRRKAGGIAVASNELLLLATPAAEAAYQRQLVDGLVTFTDATFLSDAAEVADTSPAGILNGATATVSAGDPATDLAILLDGFTSLAGVAIVAAERTAIALAAAGIFRNGVLYETLPVVLSTAAGDNLIAIDMPRVLYADDGEAEVDVVNQATLDMDSAPPSVPPTEEDPIPTQVSLWQANASAVKVLRWMNWQALSDAVRVITDVTY